jgi:translocation and assembly module TamA
MFYSLRGNNGRLSSLVLLIISCLATQGYAEVSVTGIDNTEATKNVLLMLSLEKEECKTPEWKVDYLFEKAPDEIDQALRAVGYYHGRVEKSLTRDEKCWHAQFKVDPGPQTRVEAVDVIINGEAGKDAHFTNWLENLPVKKGDELNHARYESIKSQLTSLAQATGFLQGRLREHQLIIDPEHNRAHIKIVFDSGPQLMFGAITLDQDVLNPDFVREYLTFEHGQFYSTKKLAETQAALASSNYFKSVDIWPDLDHVVNEQVPIAITLTPKPKHHYTFGIGYDTDKGPLLNAGYADRYINRRGHFFAANLDLSPVLSTLDAEYTIPLADPTKNFFTIGGGLKREDTDTYKSMTAKVSANLKHAYDNGWKQTLFLDYSYEDFTAGSESGKTLLLVPGANWLRSVSDNPTRPTNGHRLELQVQGSYKNPISDVSFIQGYLSGVWIKKLPLNGKFLGRTELGATMASPFEKLPTTYRFYAGGMNSVRGYNYKELGPKDSEGTVIGGRFLTVLSAEYEQAIFDNWGVAAFIDTGNAYNLPDLTLKTGAGLGVRWYSPIGPIRIDFAIPLSESESSFQIHFAAGTRL